MLLLKPKVYRRWKKDFGWRETWLGYYSPFERVRIGDRGYICNERYIKICEAACCELDIYLSPIEIVIIANNLNLEIDDFVSISNPSFYISKDEALIWDFLRLKKSGKKCIFNQHLKCKIYPI